MNFITKY